MLTSMTAREAASAASFWWNAQGSWVEPANRRRGGESGVQRLELDSGAYYIKRQTNHLFRSLRYPGGRPTLLREWHNLRICKRLGIPTPAVVCFDMRRSHAAWQALLVTKALDGYVSLQSGLAAGYWSRADLARILGRIISAIAPLHLARRKHGHLYPKEVFVLPHASREQVAFVDLEVSRRVATRRHAAWADMRRLCRSLLELGLDESLLWSALEQYRAHGIDLPRDRLISPPALPRLSLNRR